MKISREYPRNRRSNTKNYRGNNKRYYRKRILMASIFSVCLLLSITVIGIAQNNSKLVELFSKVNGNELEEEIKGNTTTEDLVNDTNDTDNLDNDTTDKNDLINDTNDKDDLVNDINDNDEKETKPNEDNTSDKKKKKVYLTFDDGPSVITEQLLDLLNKYDAKATFFVTGDDSEFAKRMYKRIVDEGHTLAMHSYSHNYKTLYLSKESFVNDYKKISELLYETTGVHPKYYRFPGGSSNTVSALGMRTFIDILDKEGIEYFDWNISSEDAIGRKITVDEIYHNVCDNLQYYSVPVVLMHDLKTKQTTLDAMPKILDYIYNNDMVAAAIDETTTPVQHVRKNRKQ